MPFETPQYPLNDLLDMVDDGRIQLPGFQRLWNFSQLNKLDEIRRIRNGVAHFRPNPLTGDQRPQVEIFAGMVKSLMP